MFEIIAVICLVSDFGNNSSNECFYLEKGKYETQAACKREADKHELKVVRELRKQFGDDYVYIMDSVCLKNKKDAGA